MKGIIPADVVWDGVGNYNVLETTRTELVVIIRVTPRPKSITFGVGKDRRMVKVCSVWF